MQQPLHFPLFAGDRAHLLHALQDLFAAGQRVQIATINAEFCVEAVSRSDFAAVLQRSLCVIDSFGVRWAAVRDPRGKNALLMLSDLFCSVLFGVRWAKAPIFPTVIPWADLVVDLCQFAAEQGYSVGFLWAAPWYADAIADALKKRFPRLVVAYTTPPETPFQWYREELPALRASGAQIVFVALGAPKQDLFVDQALLPSCPNVLCALGVGGTFDYYARPFQRAPWIFRAARVEWLYRLFREPRRFPRIWRAIWTFPRLVCLGRISFSALGQVWDRVFRAVSEPTKKTEK